MKLSVCGTNFVTSFAPCELPHFCATTKLSDSHEKNASDLVVKLDFDFNIPLTFRGYPKFLAQLNCCMPCSRTPVGRDYSRVAFALHIKSRHPHSVQYMTELYRFTFVTAYNISVYASLWSLPSSLQDSIQSSLSKLLWQLLAS